jgi:predicted transposase YbfD/YdcC
VKTDEKSNEIRVIPDLSSLLEIKGFLASIDAMGSQKNCTVICFRFMLTH